MVLYSSKEESRRLKKVEQPGLSDVVYDELRRAIFTGELSLGCRLNIRELAEELSVSPSPIMVAVRRLSQEGLVAIKPRVGSFVAEMSRPQIQMRMEVREMMESFAIQKFQPSGDIIARLESSVARMNEIHSVDSPGSYWEFNEYDAQFHEALISMLDNPLMKDIYRQLHFHFWMGRLILTEEGQMPKWRASRGDHDIILDALKNGNIPLAADVLSQHLRATRLLIESYNNPNDDLQDAPVKSSIKLR